MVVKDGDIYVADIPITPGAFNPANWTTLFNVDDLAPLLDAKVDVAGDTMTGMLTLPVTTPTVANHATRKGYVDAQDTALQNAINLKLSDAPVDGLTYGRKDAAWSTVIGGASMLDGPPSAPLQNGQLWYETDTGNTYVYYNDGNSSQWVQQSGSLAVPLPPSIDGALISDGPPASPQAGQMWWESDSGRLFVWFNDGTSSQWVQISGPLKAPSPFKRTVISATTTAFQFDEATLTADVEVIGAGGAGGYSTGPTSGAGLAVCGGGGGGGGYAKKLIQVTSAVRAATKTIVVGVGAAYAAGGNTTYNDGINTVTGVGGGMGVNSTVWGANANFYNGGTGGTASGGDVNIAGINGMPGHCFGAGVCGTNVSAAVGGAGGIAGGVGGQGGKGNSYGGATTALSGAGTAGGFGCGGGGAAGVNNAANPPSSAGGGGYVIITEYQ